MKKKTGQDEYVHKKQCVNPECKNMYYYDPKMENLCLPCYYEKNKPIRQE